MAESLKKIQRKESIMQSTKVGYWFHSYNEEDEIEWQGKILSVDGDYYQAQLYSWIDGGESDIKTVRISDTKDWKFYRTNKQMVESYLTYSEKLERRQREAARTAAAMEVAYRRGFQQGFETAKGKCGNMEHVPSSIQVATWRFAGDEAKATKPPGHLLQSDQHGLALDRHRMEAEARGLKLKVFQAID
jgi:hypothetical protein